MVFIKKVVNSDPGTADLWGGNDIDTLDDYYDDVNEDASRTAKINTKTRYRDQKLQLLNPAATNTLSVGSPAIVAATTKTFPVIMGPYRFTILKEGSNYYAMKNDGSILTSGTGTNFETVLQAAITQCVTDGGGDIYLPGMGSATPYIMPNTMTGFVIGTGSATRVYGVNIVCGLDAWIKMPNSPNSTGKTFCRFDDGTQHCGWYGGVLYQSTPSEDWTAFEFYSDSGTGNTGGCAFNTLERTHIKNAALAIQLTDNGTAQDAYVNGNYFHDVLIHSCDMGIKFVQTDVYTSGSNSMNRNLFNNVIIEHANRASALYGVKDVIGRDNMFIHCKVWDIGQTGTYHTCTITANAENTIILGGIMRQVGWPADNLSTTTWAYDMWGGGAFYLGVPRMNDNYEDGKTISAPSSPGTGYVRQYSKVVDSNNDGRFYKAKINGAVVEVQI